MKLIEYHILSLKFQTTVAIIHAVTLLTGVQERLGTSRP